MFPSSLADIHLTLPRNGMHKANATSFTSQSISANQFTIMSEAHILVIDSHFWQILHAFEMRVKQFTSLLKAAATAAFEVGLAFLTIKGLLKCRGGYFLFSSSSCIIGKKKNKKMISILCDCVEWIESLLFRTIG